MWSFDASRFFPADTSTGIAEVKDQVSFAVHPNPVNRDKGFSISTSLSGSIVFYDELGRIVDERKLMRGINSFKLNIDNEVIIYRAILDGGVTENGKIVCF